MADGYRIVHHAEVVDGIRQVVLSEYDVIRNSDDQVMNDKPLHVRAAERLVSKLPRAVATQPEKVPIMANHEEKIRWRKIGGGSFRTKAGRIIKPNQVFEATIDEIPLVFRDVIVPVDALPEEKPLEVVSSSYRIISKGPGWYDVVDGQGKVVNEKSLRQPEAKALIERLLG